ncbi:MAG: hypothetical protein F6K26_14625 [Moorea sp. SIO2I5]|nr:hypothetical protein [Moorena sp. SIO2I5]
MYVRWWCVTGRALTGAESLKIIGFLSLTHPTPYTLHPTPYTLHPTPYTTLPIPDSRFPIPDSRFPTPDPIENL